MLELRVGRDQLIGTQHITCSIGLPNHLEGQELAGRHGAKDAQGLAQFLGTIHRLEVQARAARNQEGDRDVIADGIGITGLATGVGAHRSRDVACLLYTSPSPRDVEESRMPSSA